MMRSLLTAAVAAALLVGCGVEARDGGGGAVTVDRVDRGVTTLPTPSSVVPHHDTMPVPATSSTTTTTTPPDGAPDDELVDEFYRIISRSNCVNEKIVAFYDANPAPSWEQEAAAVRPLLGKLADAQHRAAARIARVDWPTAIQGLADQMRADVETRASLTDRMVTAASRPELHAIDYPAGSDAPEKLRAWLGLRPARADTTDYCKYAATHGS